MNNPAEKEYYDKYWKKPLNSIYSSLYLNFINSKISKVF